MPKIEVKFVGGDKPKPRPKPPKDTTSSFPVKVRIVKGSNHTKQSQTTKVTTSGITAGIKIPSKRPKQPPRPRPQRKPSNRRLRAVAVPVQLELPQKPVRFRNIFLAAGVLAVVIVLLGVAYIYFSSNVKVLNNPKASLDVYRPLKTPPKPAASAPESATVTLVDSPVKLGGAASLSVQTLPGSKCDLTLAQNNKELDVNLPGPQTADDFGTASWDWNISRTVPVGSDVVVVTCSYHKKTAVVQTDIVVKS